MNFIFDIGNVLIDFKPKLFLHKLFENSAYEDKINDIVFKSREWVRLDEGTITPKEACSVFCMREPEYREQITKTMEKLPEMLTRIPETTELLPKIKAAGHSLFYLSNYHKELSSYIQKQYSFFDLFDGGVFSCDVHLLKPSSEIYRYFLSKYGLDPHDCVFFDDVEENVRGAENAGIKGILFTDAQQIREFIACAV